MKLRNFVLSVCWLSSISLSAQTLPYQDPSLTAHQRAVDLCGRLTLEEKAQLMLGCHRLSGAHCHGVIVQS